MVMPPTVARNVCMPIHLKNYLQHMQWIAVMFNVRNSRRTRNSPTFRCNYRHPLVYADFESILKPVNEDVDVTKGVDTGAESSSTVFQEHIPSRFAYKIVSSVNPDFSRPLVMYRGEDAAERFVRDLQLEAKQLCEEDIAKPKPMLFTATDSLSFANTTTCHICTEQLGDDKVCDHCHITGNYRGAAHDECNLNYRINPKSWKLPVVIHNLKGYDVHLVVKPLKSEFGKVTVIPQNLEKYLSLPVGQLKCLDFFQLRYLVESCTTSHFELIRRKGVYPYDYMDMVDKFRHNRRKHV